MTADTRQTSIDNQQAAISISIMYFVVRMGFELSM
jgi:hypothetical protein